MIKKLFFTVIFICLSEIATAIPINPDKVATPVVITDADKPSTYTGTWLNPFNIRIREGTVTSVTTIQQGTVTIIDKPIWEAQPTAIRNITLLVELSSYATYTYPATWTFSVVGYDDYLEYIIIVRDEPYPIDNYSFEFHTKQLGNSLFLGGEVAPASGQSIFKPCIPIQVKAGSGEGYRFILWNKSAYAQKFKVGLIFSQRKAL